MYILPLLLSANPKNASNGPIVRLPKGNWKVAMEGIKDTILWLKHGDLPTHILEDNYIMAGNEYVQVGFENKGTESNISVLVQQI